MPRGGLLPSTATANAEELSVGSTEIATTVAARGGDFAPCPSGALGCGGSDTGPSVPDLTHGASAEEVVDLAQAALEVTAASEVPIVSHAAGAVSIIIDAAKGDWVGAGLGLAGLIPVIGNAADIAKIARRADKAIDRARELGRAGELAAGITGPKRAINVGGRKLFPDEINRVARTLTEVKNVGKLSYTRQLRDYAAYANSQNQNLKFILVTRPGTKLSRPLRKAIESGDIINRPTLPF